MDPNQNPNNDPNANPTPDTGAPTQPQPSTGDNSYAPQPAAQPPVVETEPSTGGQVPPAPAPAAPYAAPAAQAENPGQTLGIVSIVLDVIGLSIIGLILGIISRKKSKAAGQSTTLGTIGMVLGIVFTVIGLLYFVAIVLVSYAGIQQSAREAQESATTDSSFQSEMTPEETDPFTE